MFRATKRWVTIEVTCEDGTIEIKSLARSFFSRKSHQTIAAHEKALLLCYLIQQQGRVSEEELLSYFTGRGWKVLYKAC